MDRSLVFGAVAVLFCIRDARLLRVRPRLAFAYGPMLLLAGAMCGLAAESLSADGALAVVLDVRFWLPAIAVHAALSYGSARRSRLGKPPDWLSVLPGPVLCAAMVGAGRLALARIDDSSGLATGLALGCAFAGASGLVAATGLLGRDAAGSLRFAAVTHLSALLVVPALAAPESPLAAQPVDWRVTALVLGAVGTVLLLSFAWHRARSR